MNRDALVWITSDDTGISSRTIWAVMLGAVHDNGMYGIPRDVVDFGRCHRLLEIIPEWRPRIQEVAELFPKWKHVVDAWGELEIMYEQGRLQCLSSRIRELRGCACG